MLPALLWSPLCSGKGGGYVGAVEGGGVGFASVQTVNVQK